jgi:hypothetical protein
MKTRRLWVSRGAGWNEALVGDGLLPRVMWLTAVFFILLQLLTVIRAGAKVSPQEAAKLGAELTPLGAIRAGNDDGTIPPWEGGISSPPAGYQRGTHHLDPYAADRALFTITAENVQQYEAMLCPGQTAMFRRYPSTWRMPVYPTRRSASFPPRVYEATIANATTAETVEGGNGVASAVIASPFPIPQTGVEAIWNHILRYRSTGARYTFAQAVPTPGGDYTTVKIEQRALFPYAVPGATIESINNKAIYFLEEVLAPPRLAGELLLVHETVNQVKEPRQAWTYNAGQRRVRRAPNVAYDNPGTAADGQRTSDQLDMFNGAPDRYEWTLVGRKEMYVPYNNYQLASDQVPYDRIIRPGHLNPEVLRYELHRVWVVEAKLREGTSHIYARRTFYFDEDSWQALAVDQYDGRGELWRHSEAYVINYYEVPLLFQTVETHYDLQNGRYLVLGLNNQEAVEAFDVPMSLDDFTPDALRRMGRR